jgi:hypothetical protein
MTSCEKKYETEGLSKITYYAVFEMTGSDLIKIVKGTSFVDPGCTATENGATINVATSVLGTFTGFKGTSVDANISDKYEITYSAVNKDGYAASTSRIVWVAENNDLTASIAGLYTASVGRGVPSSSTTAQYKNMPYILISDLGNNTFAISDALGGYYSIGRAYGDNYSFIGAKVTVNNYATSDVTANSKGVAPAWGNIAELSDFVIDQTAKKISFKATADIANGVFNVELTKVEL